MDSATQRLRSLKDEADKCAWADFDRDEGPILNDEQVAHLLLGDPLLRRLDPEGESAAVRESADESDALEVMRGLLIGTAWAVPIWGLISATVVLVGAFFTI
jgi:hypothetical protein